MTDPAKDFRAERALRLKDKPRIVADTRGEILRLLKIAQARLIAVLAAQPSSAEQWILPQLQREIAQAMQEFSTAASARLTDAAGRSWEAGQALIDTPLAAGDLRIVGAVPVLDTRQLLAMRAFMADRIKDVGLQAANKINMELGLVVIGAQPVAEAVGKVATILDDAPRARAINIARTELSRVYAVASDERSLQAAEIVPGMQKQWRRSGKVHSRIAHDLADGQIQDVGKPFKLANGVTLMFPHDPKAPAKEVINCGCTSIPFMKEWEVTTPGRKRYTELEMQRNPMKRDIQEQLDSGKPLREIIEGGKAA